MLQERYYIPSKPEEERKRIEQYLYYESLYFGENQTTFKLNKNITSNAIYLLNNFVRLLAEFHSDLLFSEPPEFLSDNQDELDKLVKDNKLHTINLQSSVSNSYRGDAIYKVRKDEDGEVKIEEVPAMMYFPQFKNGQINQLESVILAWQIKKDKEFYVQKEIHYTDRIENKLFWLKEAKDSYGQYAGMVEIPVDFSVLGLNVPDQYENPTGEILVVHIPNYRISNYHFGISDIQSMDALLNEADYRMTQLSNILDKHADPKLAVPKGVLDARGQVRTGNLEMFEVSTNTGGMNKPEYITWDAKLEFVFKQIDLIAERIALFGRMPLGLIKNQDNNQNQPEAARALKLKFLMSLKKANRKRVYYDEGLKKVFELAGKLMDVEFDDVQIKWNDGLPEDRKEELEIMSLEKAAGVKSDEQRIREHLHKQGMDEELIDEEIEKIEEQKEKAGVGLPNSRPPKVELPSKEEQMPMNK